ncbi:MAG: nucleotidyltransferase domain-containing protein [Synergistaceae bacterium]|nr:nucleotidyltransferase domain-containing protein [Synergistaceae bacterium]
MQRFDSLLRALSQIEEACALAAVFARHPEVERVILYGSRARGNRRTGSDIDLSLQGGDDLTGLVLYSIVRELDDLPLPYSFDVAIHSMIVNEALLEDIRSRGALLYERREGGFRVCGATHP